MFVYSNVPNKRHCWFVNIYDFFSPSNLPWCSCTPMCQINVTVGLLIFMIFFLHPTSPDVRLNVWYFDWFLVSTTLLVYNIIEYNKVTIPLFNQDPRTPLWRTHSPFFDTREYSTPPTLICSFCLTWIIFNVKNWSCHEWNEIYFLI